MAAPAYVNASTGSTDAGGAWTATCHSPSPAEYVNNYQSVENTYTDKYQSTL